MGDFGVWAASVAGNHYQHRGLAEEVNEAILHAAFIPFGEIKDVKTPLDQATQKHRSFGFVTFLEMDDAAAAMDNMDNAELYGRVLTVNYALPERIKGGEQGWAAQPKQRLQPQLVGTEKIYLFFYFVKKGLTGCFKKKHEENFWADADTWFERQQQEEEMKRLQAEHQASMQVAEELHRKKLAEEREGEKEEETEKKDGPMTIAEAQAQAQAQAEALK
ncbi:hypothetical protein ACLOJK_035900 [Asimina triloba]